jgi:hypothetical protein
MSDHDIVFRDGGYWVRTAELRVLTHRDPSLEGWYEQTIQQLWVRPDNTDEWIDVPRVNELELPPK